MADLKISQLANATTPLAGTEVLPIVQSGATTQVSVANLTAGRAVNASGITTTGNSNLATTSGNVGVGTASIINVYAKNLTLRGSGSAGVGFGDGTREWAFGNNGGNIQLYDNTASASRFTVNSSGDFTLQSGNFIQGTAGKGINFTANTNAPGMTSELLNWYEEGTWTPSQGGGLTVVGTFSSSGTYTRIGRQVTAIANLNATTSVTAAAGGIACAGLPFSVSGASVGSLTTNALTQSSSASAYLDRFYSSSATTAATGLIITVTYFV